MAKFKVVVTDYEFGELNFEEAVFNECDIELVKGQVRAEEEVLQLCHDADAIISQYSQISAKVIEGLEKCKIIAKYGVGVNTVDVDAATKKGICVANVPDYGMNEVSDHALALILALTRKIVTYNDYVKKGIWDYKKGLEIERTKKQVASVIGFGRIGSRLVHKLVSLGFEVNVYDPYVDQKEIKQANANPVSFEEAIKLADVLSLNVPLTSETRGFFGEKELSMMKRSGYLVNTARGPVVDEKALIEALQNNRIAGAGLDVVEIEPILENHPFLEMDHVIVTPHAAWYSKTAAEEMRTKAARNVLEVLKGYYPTYLVNQELKGKLSLNEK